MGLTIQRPVIDCIYQLMDLTVEGYRKGGETILPGNVKYDKTAACQYSTNPIYISVWINRILRRYEQP